jgi:predicted nucleic acid-binding protein
MLLDTCIIIDVLRNSEKAVEFVTNLRAKPSLSAVTATEIIGGCKSVRERRHIDQLLSTYRVFDLDLGVASLAGEYVQKFGRSHGTEPIDALIAATAAINNTPLVTHNLKHFPMFPGLKRPY